MSFHTVTGFQRFTKYFQFIARFLPLDVSPALDLDPVERCTHNTHGRLTFYRTEQAGVGQISQRATVWPSRRGVSDSQDTLNVVSPPTSLHVL